MNTYSRFSVLSPEVDLDVAFKKKSKSRPKPEKVKKDINHGINHNHDIDLTGEVVHNVKTVNNAPKSNISNANKKKLKEDGDLQALAFGYQKSKSGKRGSSAQTSNSRKVTEEKQKNRSADKKRKTSAKAGVANGDISVDDDWKKRDEEFVKNQNEKSLREAIMRSKLEFEETKKEEEKKPVKKEEKDAPKKTKTKKKKEKPLTLSIDQFNSLQPGELASLRDMNSVAEKASPPQPPPPTVNSQKLNEEKFFKDVEEATRRTLEKEHRDEQYKAHINKVNQGAQVQKLISEVEKRDYEIQALRLEVESLRKQLQEVKSRNKKLCEVISCSEMRSKGELVVELEKVSRGRDEFSEEVTRLNAELEQERTKVSQLTTELKKIQGKKRNAESSSK